MYYATNKKATDFLSIWCHVIFFLECHNSFRKFLVSYSSCLNNWIVINYCLGSVKVSRLLILHKDLKSIATRECSFELPIRFCEFQMVNVDLLLLYIFNL